MSCYPTTVSSPRQFFFACSMAQRGIKIHTLNNAKIGSILCWTKLASSSFIILSSIYASSCCIIIHCGTPALVCLYFMVSLAKQNKIYHKIQGPNQGFRGLNMPPHTFHTWAANAIHYVQIKSIPFL